MNTVQLTSEVHSPIQWYSDYSIASNRDKWPTVSFAVIRSDHHLMAAQLSNYFLIRFTFQVDAIYKEQLLLFSELFDLLFKFVV